ncbi:hypothetical protein OSTOST_00879, partial [Ostertagia ostertagi]
MTRATHAIVFFTTSKTSDIVPLTAVSGNPIVNRRAKVRWNKKTYNAKIVHIASKALCEQKIKDVTENGTLTDNFFTVAESSVILDDLNCAATSPDPVAEVVHQMKAGMDELLEQMMMMRRNTTGALREFEIKMQGSFTRLERRIISLESSVEEIRLREEPTSAEDGIDYCLMSRERVEALLALKYGRLTKFALALEQELYEGDNSEMLLNVEDRKVTVRRVTFIREVVFKYFNVSQSSKKSVWQTVKNALNGRARTLRLRTTSISPTRQLPLSSSLDR